MGTSAIENGIMHARREHSERSEHGRQRAIIWALLVGLSLPQTLWAATSHTWKWQDSNGNITYGDTPPRGVTAERVSVRFGTSSNVPMAAAGTPAPATGTTEVAAASGISAAQAATLCQQATTNLAILDSKALIRQTDENGEERILDAQEKQAQIDTARDIIRHHCA